MDQLIKSFEIRIDMQQSRYLIWQNGQLVVAAPFRKEFDYTHSFKSALDRFLKLIEVEER